MKKINLYINNKFECAIPVEQELSMKAVFDQVADAYKHCPQDRISDTELSVNLAEGYVVLYKAA